ncbi:unnamed protein product [Periconia digitata]|uniref:Uncharacterized protein n=1 Tax=Periconia digitata TaxID=1303443 RepID=A0A9W4UDG9_9PLEO|nr:unnamed protein product [Periconia digitata]
MKFTPFISLLFASIAIAAPLGLPGAIAAREGSIDNDDYIVYPDVDRDEDVVYAYHAINDK